MFGLCTLSAFNLRRSIEGRSWVSHQLTAAVLVAALTASGFNSACFAGAPSNNDCANARVIELGENAFTNEEATIEFAIPAVCVVIGADVWFKFTSTFTGSLIISTCGDATFNTVISAYSGCACSSFTSLGCNDNGSGCSSFTSRLTIAVQAGTCYRIRVAGASGAQGTGTLTLTPGDANNAANANRILTGDNPDDRFGVSVAGNARINSGSIEDVLVGAPRNDLGGSNIGRAFAFSGSALDELLAKAGALPGDQFGYAVAVGDVNSDGRADLVVGSPLNDRNGADCGRVDAFSGLNGNLLWTTFGANSGDHFGWSVAIAGDVNDDGFDDVIAGAPLNNTGGEDAGRAYILDGENGDILKKRTGEAAGDYFGWAVAGIGDVNNDGKDDYAVGAPRHDAVASNAGRVYIYSGVNGSTLQKINGDAKSDQFGYSVAGLRFATTLNYDMVAIGAPKNDSGGSNSGRVKVYYRNISNPASGGCNTTLCLLYTINGGNPGDEFGSSVAVGNLVSSTFADIIIGAPKADFNDTSSGAVYVFNGANGALSRRIFGEAKGDLFGSAVANAGDVSAGGVNDLLVGAPYNDAGGSAAGRAYVFFMEPTSPLTAPAQAPPPTPTGGSVAGGGVIVEGGAQEVVNDPSVTFEAGIQPIGDFGGDAGDALGSPNEIDDGDVNHDGSVNTDDLIAIINAWGPCRANEDCPADLNHDGTVDADDLMLQIDAMN